MTMIPKTWATLSDALDEGCAHAARKAVEAMQEKHPDDHDGKQLHARLCEDIRTEVTNAICERFVFVEPKED